MRIKVAQRPGTTIVEFALVAPLTLLLLIGLVVGGMGIFRYQEVATLSRQASRYASVHGTQYQADTGQPAATATDIYNNAIAANNVNLDLSQLQYSVTWNPPNDNRPFHTI